MNQSSCVGPAASRLRLDPSFRPCEPEDGDELFANGIFNFNITRLLAHVDGSDSFPIELIALADVPCVRSEASLDQTTVASADPTRPVILAEIAPGRFNLIDGHHRLAKARRLGLPDIAAYRIRCPEHVAFLTSARAYEAYVDYWNSKIGHVP